MDGLQQALENFEKKSMIFGGKKRLIDILEWLAENKVSLEELIAYKKSTDAAFLTLREAIASIQKPAPIFNVTFDPEMFKSSEVKDKPGHHVITLKPEVVMRIEQSEEKINLIANFIIPEE